MKWYQTFFLVLTITLGAVNLSYQLPPQPVDDSAQLLQKVKEIEESNAENADTFRKQLHEHSVEIEKIKNLEESLRQMAEQNLILSQALRNFQERQFKKEVAFNSNIYAVRLFLQTTGLKLGEMLMSAIKDNDVPRVQLLLDLGAPIEFQDAKGNRPIHIATQNRYARILDVLINNHVDVDSKGENQKTALHIAGYSECLECAKILVKYGARLESRDEWLNTPIIHPARVGFNDIVEFLLQEGANVNAAQRDGITGLHWAAREGQLSTVTLLVKNGADVRLKTRDGKTALDYATATNHRPIIEFLENLEDK